MGKALVRDYQTLDSHSHIPGLLISTTKLILNNVDTLDNYSLITCCGLPSEDCISRTAEAWDRCVLESLFVKDLVPGLFC